MIASVLHLLYRLIQIIVLPVVLISIYTFSPKIFLLSFGIVMAAAVMAFAFKEA
jgi:hypothetical protein